MANIFSSRDLINGIEGVPNTFSSWDKCMSKAYCKWPVIAAIIVASLIVFSVLWCLARCLCCGASCCCSCLRCLDCFTPGRHERREPRYKDQYQPMPSQGFQPAPAPMIYQINALPQTATFDAPTTRVHDDSLPPMPSWDTAPKKRVEDTSVIDEPAHGRGEDVEMGRLEQQSTRTGRSGYSQIPGSQNQPSPAPAPYDPHEESTAYFGAAGAPQPHFNSNYPPPRQFGSQQVPVRTDSYASTSRFHSPPHSPAPTYATVAPDANPDRFIQRSNGQAQYYQNTTPHYNQYSSHESDYDQTPYVPSVSTRYEATEYPVPSPYTSPTQRRPPTLLQPGRKPVGGSLREI